MVLVRNLVLATSILTIVAISSTLGCERASAYDRREHSTYTYSVGPDEYGVMCYVYANLAISCVKVH